MSLSPPHTPSQPRTRQTPVDRRFVDQRRFIQVVHRQPGGLSRQFHSQRLYPPSGWTVTAGTNVYADKDESDELRGGPLLKKLAGKAEVQTLLVGESQLPALGIAEAAADTDRPLDKTDDVASLLDQGGQLLAKLEGQASAAVVQALLGGESPLGVVVRHRIAKAAVDADRLFDEATEDVAALLDQGGELLAQLEGQASAAVVQALLGGESPLPALVRHRIAKAAADTDRPPDETDNVASLLDQGGQLLAKLEGQASAAVVQALLGGESPLGVVMRHRIAKAAADADRLFDEATEDVAALLDQGGELLAQLEGQASAAVVQALLGGESPLPALVRHRIAKAAADTDRPVDETDDVAALLDQGGQLLAQLEGQASAAVVQALLGGESPLGAVVRLRIAKAAADADRLFDEATEDVAALLDQGGELLAQLEGQALAAVVQALLGGESPLPALVRHRIAKAAADTDRPPDETDDVAALLDQGGQLLAQLEGQASAAVVQALLGGESPLPALVRLRIAEVSKDSYSPHKEAQDLRRTLFDEDKEQRAMEAHPQGKADEPGRLSDTAEQCREVLHADGHDHGRMGAQVSTNEEQAAEEVAANQAFADLDQAATKIQAIARGRSERRRHKTRKARNTQREANDWPLGQRVAGRPSAAAPAKTEEEQAAEEMAANQAFEDLDQAATKIQAIARGRSERRRHKTRKERREERGEETHAKTEEDQAAEEISANEMYRGLESAAIKIQSRARGISVRKRHDKRARRSHQASPPGRRPAMQVEEEEFMLADAAETALPDTPVRPRSAMRAHSRRPHTPHAPTSSPAVTVVHQETVERKMAKFRQEMLEAVANVQRDYRARCAELEARIHDIEQKRQQQVAALEAEKAAISAQSQQLAAELEAARRSGAVAGEEDGRSAAEVMARGLSELGELGVLLTQSATLMQALGPQVGQNLTATMLDAAAAEAAAAAAAAEAEHRLRRAGEYLSACLRRVTAMTMLKQRKQAQQRREQRARERTEAAAAAQRQREEARAAAARAAASLNATAQAESIAAERAKAAAAAAKQAADDAAQAANAKARATVEFEEHSRECERAETAAEVAAAQAAAALERSLRDDLSDDASSVYAEDSVLQEQGDLEELPFSVELSGSEEATVSEEALDFLIATMLQQAQSELEFDRHAENISHAVLATALSQLEQEDADALTYQGALSAVTPVNTDGAGEADTAFSLEIVGRPIAIHRAYTLTQDDDDTAREAGEPARQTPSRHVRFSDQDDSYDSDLLVSAHAGGCAQQDQSAAAATADTAEEEARGNLPVEQAEASAGVHASPRDVHLQQEGLESAAPGGEAAAADGEMVELLQEGGRLLEQLPQDAVAASAVADVFVSMVIVEAQDELAQDACVRNANAGVHDDVAQASQQSVHDAAEPEVPKLEDGVHARMCASADATATDETLAVVAALERSGPHMGRLVLQLGDDIIASLSISPPQTPRSLVERLFVDQRRFSEQPAYLSPAPQFQSQRLYSSDRTYLVDALGPSAITVAAQGQAAFAQKLAAQGQARPPTPVGSLNVDEHRFTEQHARLVPQTPARPRTPVERLFVDQRRFNEQPACLSPAPQFQSERLYSSDRTYLVDALGPSAVHGGEANAAEGEMMELLQEGGRLLDQLPQDAVQQLPQDVVQLVEVLVQRPQSPVARALSVHHAAEPVPCDENPAAASRKEAEASAALDAYVDAYVRMVIVEAQDELVQAQAEELSAVSDAFVRMVLAEARTELVQAMPKSLLPVRRPIPVSTPSSPSKGHGLDVEVTVNMKFNEDFDWLTADEHRKTSWSERIMGIVCDAVKVSPRRIRMAGLRRGSVCLLLRCLPLSETPGLADSDCRSAMELGIQILAFASAKDAGTKLLQFLGGTLHSPTEKALSCGASPVGKAASTSAGPGGRDESAAELDKRARDEVREEVEQQVGLSSNALSPNADKGVQVDGVLGDGEEEKWAVAHKANDVEARLEHELEEEKSLSDTMLEEAAASSESEQKPVEQRSSAVELGLVEDTLEALPTTPREAVLIDKVEGLARPVDIDTAEGAQDESSLSSLSIQGSQIEDVTGTPTPAHSDLQPPPPPVEVIFEDKLGEFVGAAAPKETQAERVVDEEDVTRRLFSNHDEPATVADEVAAEKMSGSRQMIDDNQRAQVDQDSVKRAGGNERLMLGDEKEAGGDLKKKRRKKRRVNLRKPGASSPHVQPKMIAADRERLAILDTQRAVEEQHRRDLQVAAEKERLRDRQDKRVRAQIQNDQTLHVKWVMDRNQWESASAARAKSPHMLAHGVEQQRVTYSLGRHREARHRAALDASASYQTARPAASRSASPTATPSARVNNMATSTPHPKAFMSAATPHPKAFHSAANGDSPPSARRIAWYEDGDFGDDGNVGESENVHAPVRPSTASNGGRARSPGSASSRPTSSADMFSEPVDPEESHVKPRRRRQKPQPVSTSDDVPSHIQLARSPYGSTKPGLDLQRTTVTTPPARYAKKVRQSASPSSAPASVHFSAPGSPASPGSRMQQLRTLAQSNRERGFETAASGARRPSTAPPNKSFPPHPAPSDGARGVGSQLPAPDSTRQPIDQAAADRRRKDLIMGVLSESQLFGPMLVGDTCLGRVKLPIAALLEHPGAVGSVELPVHNSSGRPLLGLDGHLSTVTMSWKDSDECLSVVVERASHLPKAKRFGLCDTQVTVECGLYKFSTDVARCDLNPYFNTVYHFPKPLMLASAASQHLLVSIMHVDIRDLLEDVAQQCLVVAAEPGAQIMQSGQEADRMLVLASGSVGVWCSQEASAAGAHAGARAGSPPRSPAQTGRGLSPKRRRRGASGKGAGAAAADARQPQKEIGTISLRGTCFGDLAVLTGKRPQYTLVASSEVWLVQVPRAAISSLLQQQPDVAEHMAHAVCQHLHVHGIHSLPEFVNLDFGECDPTVFMQLEGQRSCTSSLRFNRAPGTEPRWNQSFTFKNVAFDAKAAGRAGAGGGASAAPHGLQMIVCEVDAFGQLDYILGQAHLPLTTLLRVRRLVGNLPLSGIKSDRPASETLYYDRAGGPANAYMETRLAHEQEGRGPSRAGGAAAEAEQYSTNPYVSERRRGDAETWQDEKETERGMDIYEDDDDSGGEDGRNTALGVSGGAEYGGGQRERGSSATSILRGGAGGQTRPGGGMGGSAGGESAMLSVDVRVEGCYFPGEKDLLQALRSVGFETCFAALRSGGIQAVDDLVVQHLDEARIAWLCPNLSAAKRRLLVERTELRRREGFLSQNAERVAQAVRAYHRLPPREPTVLTQVLADLKQRACTLSDFESSRPNSRPPGVTNVINETGGAAESVVGSIEKVEREIAEAQEHPWKIQATPDNAVSAPHSAPEIRTRDGEELADESSEGARGGVERAEEMAADQVEMTEAVNTQEQACEIEAGTDEPGSKATGDAQDQGQEQRVLQADDARMDDRKDEKAILLGEAREMLARLPSSEAIALLETVRGCSSPVAGLLRASMGYSGGGEEGSGDAELSRALVGLEQAEEEIQELMAAGRRLLELLAPQDRDEVVGMLALGDTPLSSHLLGRITENRTSIEHQPAAYHGARLAASEELLYDLLERGRELIDVLGPEAFDAISAALAHGESTVAASLRQVSVDCLRDKDAAVSPH